MPKFGNFDGAGMLSSLKSRLGLDDSRKDRDEEAYDDFDDAYEDERDGYDEGYEDEWSEYAPDAYETRAEPGAYRPVSTRSTTRRSESPRLVSIEDVKRHTSGGNRSALDDALPPVDSYGHDARRAEGVDSLFQPTSPIDPIPSSQVTASSTYDPYDALLASTPSSYTASRAMTVIKPVSYSDVQRVAKSVKSGDVVVLAMRNTPDDLAKRILDFSFGVASALDASVECPGDKVFAIARGAALTDDEKQRLRNQGAL